MRTAKNKHQKGYTLLEYCAGAAIVVTVLYGALDTLGGNVSKFLGGIGTWAAAKGDAIKAQK